ncbi:conjugal transfer protein [Escherichia albertii]|nr:conjugal transfer protein [Escherichia albertii]
MKKLIAGLFLILLTGCQTMHSLPKVSGELEPINSTEVIANDQ